MESIRYFWQNTGVKLRSLIVLLMVGVIVIIVVAIVNLWPKPKFDQQVTVDNFDDVKNMPDGYKAYIQENIGKILRDNSIIDGSATVDATIREGTYKEIKGKDNIESNFVVDIEPLKYSFDVTAIWPKEVGMNQEITDPNITVECPYYLDVIYTDTKCIAESPEQQIKKYLPHYGRVDGVKYAVDPQSYNDQSYLRVEAEMCGNEVLKENIMSDLKKWIKSRYLDPNDYKIEMTDICGR